MKRWNPYSDRDLTGLDGVWRCFKVEFCPECATRLIVRFQSRGALYCVRCGYKEELPDGHSPDDPTHGEEVPDAGIVVLDRNAMQLLTHPTISSYCERCGDGRAEAWTLAFGSDGVSGIILHRCLSCGHTWREIE